MTMLRMYHFGSVEFVCFLIALVSPITMKIEALELLSTKAFCLDDKMFGRFLAKAIRSLKMSKI